MYLNCGQVRRAPDGGAQIEIWEGDEAYVFWIVYSDLRRLLQDEKGVPIRKFGLPVNVHYGYAWLSARKIGDVDREEGPARKGVLLRMDCFQGRKFSVARAALTNVAQERWMEAAVSEIIPDPAPRSGTVRMGVLR